MVVFVTSLSRFTFSSLSGEEESRVNLSWTWDTMVPSRVQLAPSLGLPLLGVRSAGVVRPTLSCCPLSLMHRSGLSLPESQCDHSYVMEIDPCLPNARFRVILRCQLDRI